MTPFNTLLLRELRRQWLKLRGLFLLWGITLAAALPSKSGETGALPGVLSFSANLAIPAIIAFFAASAWSPEIRDRRIDFLLQLPISPMRIFAAKAAAGLLYVATAAGILLGAAPLYRKTEFAAAIDETFSVPLLFAVWAAMFCASLWRPQEKGTELLGLPALALTLFAAAYLSGRPEAVGPNLLIIGGGALFFLSAAAVLWHRRCRGCRDGKAVAAGLAGLLLFNAILIIHSSIREVLQ